ncbi:MAG: hypothetical protein P9L92_15040 [Candidatus Electryonea clarkiae]|nr:hypothetical protein [Candidatus Electryonea clarkiae]MDP8288967.1 hypothetical protein [Candidatus Electryonea clarkiae]
MIHRVIGETAITIEHDPKIPTLSFPLGESVKHRVVSDIDVKMGVGNLCVDVPHGKPVLKRGEITATGDRKRIIWTHPAIGSFIESLPMIGSVRIMMPISDWLRTPDILHQVIMPGLMFPLVERRIIAIHASAVIYNGKGILFAGPSGSGKTTLALRMVDKGAIFVAEDMIFLTIDDKVGFVAWGLGDTPRADKAAWNRFSKWNPGKKDWAGKMSISIDNIRHAKKTVVSKLFWLGKSRDGQAHHLLSLLSASFHSINLEQTSKILAKFIEDVGFTKVSHPDEAFSLALKKTP